MQCIPKNQQKNLATANKSGQIDFKCSIKSRTLIQKMTAFARFYNTFQ